MKMRFTLISFLILASIKVWALEVAIIDTRLGIFQSDEAQEALKEPQEQIKAIEEQIQQESEELQEMSAALQRDELTLSEAALEVRQREIAQRDAVLRNKVVNLQRQAQLVEQQIIANLRPKVEEIIQQIVDEKKIDLLLNRQTSVYFSPSLDITSELTSRMNESD